MILSAVYVVVVAQSSLEVPEGLMNNPVYGKTQNRGHVLKRNTEAHSCNYSCSGKAICIIYSMSVYL